MKDLVKLYAERDPEELEPYRMQHLMAMTAEGLHSKADIADELAYRDKCIAELDYWKDCAQVSMQMKAGKIQALEQRIAELEQQAKNYEENFEEKSFVRRRMNELNQTLAELNKANRQIEQLREALGKIIIWIDGDTRAINRDVGIGNCDYNDIYESLDKLEKIATDALEASA